MTRSALATTRQGRLTLMVLLAFAAAAWVVVVWQAEHGMRDSMAMGLTMGMSPALFLALWTVMMAAMMLPSAAPMVLVFARVAADQRASRLPAMATALFVGGYLVAWAAAGVLAFIAAVAADGLGRPFCLAHGACGATRRRQSAAGRPLPAQRGQACLPGTLPRAARSCSIPGARAAAPCAWGMRHGLICLGSSGVLFLLLLLPLGMMNLGAMLLLTLLIFAEKVPAAGKHDQSRDRDGADRLRPAGHRRARRPADDALSGLAPATRCVSAAIALNPLPLLPILGEGAIGRSTTLSASG